MLTTLVFAVTGLTVVLSLLTAFLIDFDQENFWDPRTQVVRAATIIGSCLQHSQLLVSQAWSRVSRRMSGRLSHNTQIVSVSQRLPIAPLES